MTLLIAVVKAEFPDIQRKAAISSRFSSVVHKDENDIKSPRSLFRTDFAGFCVRGGQMVVTISEKDFWEQGRVVNFLFLLKPSKERGQLDRDPFGDFCAMNLDLTTTQTSGILITFFGHYLQRIVSWKVA